MHRSKMLFRASTIKPSQHLLFGLSAIYHSPPGREVIDFAHGMF